MKNIYVLNSKNPFITDNFHLEEKNHDIIHLTEALKSTILYDYRYGIKTAHIKIIPSDMYNDNNELIKEWSSGKILSVNDNVKVLDKTSESILRNIDGTDMKFKVYGRKFTYDGQPTIDLDLMQIRQED